MTLIDYLRFKHNSVNALNKKETEVLGINYPLEKGWVKEYGDMMLMTDTITRLKNARTSTLSKG